MVGNLPGSKNKKSNNTNRNLQEEPGGQKGFQDKRVRLSNDFETIQNSIEPTEYYQLSQLH